MGKQKYFDKNMNKFFLNIIRKMLKQYSQGNIKNVSRISQERYEIERKCQWKLDSKSYLGFRMVKIFLTSGS